MARTLIVLVSTRLVEPQEAYFRPSPPGDTTPRDTTPFFKTRKNAGRSRYSTRKHVLAPSESEPLRNPYHFSDILIFLFRIKNFLLISNYRSYFILLLLMFIVHLKPYML